MQKATLGSVRTQKHRSYYGLSQEFLNCVKTEDPKLKTSNQSKYS
jgi:hypothetical protein